MRLVRVLDPGLAECKTGDGSCHQVLIGLIDDARIGDVLLVHAGTALTRLDSPSEEAP